MNRLASLILAVAITCIAAAPAKAQFNAANAAAAINDAAAALSDMTSAIDDLKDVADNECQGAADYLQAVLDEFCDGTDCGGYGDGYITQLETEANHANPGEYYWFFVFQQANINAANAEYASAILEMAKPFPDYQQVILDAETCIVFATGNDNLGLPGVEGEASDAAGTIGGLVNDAYARAQEIEDEGGCCDGGGEEEEEGEGE